MDPYIYLAVFAVVFAIFTLALFSFAPPASASLIRSWPRISKVFSKELTIVIIGLFSLVILGLIVSYASLSLFPSFVLFLILGSVIIYIVFYFVSLILRVKAALESEIASATEVAAKLVQITEEVKKVKRNYPGLSIVGVFRNRLSSSSSLGTLIGLSITGIYISVCRIASIPLRFNAVVFILFFLFLLLLYNSVVSYRIKKGFYLNNEIEARELISFVQANSDKIDFKGGGGQSKRIFSLDDLEDIVVRMVGEIQGG